MFISLTQTEEANLSGGDATASSTGVVTNGAAGQDGAAGQNGVSGQDGAAGKNAVSGQAGVLNLQSSELILINRKKELLEKLLLRLRSLRKR
ncbi:MAG: hypothetical protein V7K77_25140 [Nostoc sp.]